MTGRLKPLVKTFSYNEIIEECEKQGWRLPTLAEVRDAELEYSCVWISDRPSDYEWRGAHHRVFDVSKPDIEITANKQFRFHVVVVVNDKRCSNCSHLYNNWKCEIYDLDIKNVIGVPVTDFGCTPNFKMKVN